MKSLKILIDPNYPDELVNALKDIHALQEEITFEIYSWHEGIENQFPLSESVFLAVDHSKKGLSEIVVKQLEDGYRMFVMKLGTGLNFFEFAMTVLRVWPHIIKKSLEGENKSFCYTFNYGGKQLTLVKKH